MIQACTRWKIFCCVKQLLSIYCSCRPDPGVSLWCLFNVMVGWVTTFVPTILFNLQNSPEDLEWVFKKIIKIALAWPALLQYSQLLTMLLDHPILVPQFPKLILSPDQKPHPLLLEEELFLTAWSILSKITRCKVFQRGLQSFSFIPGDNTNSFYNSAWHRWHCWCAEWSYNPTSTLLTSFLQFSWTPLTNLNNDGIFVCYHPPLVSHLLRDFPVHFSGMAVSTQWNLC